MVAQSRPSLATFHRWAEAQRLRVSAKSALAKTLQYALGRGERLTRYTEDGRLPIDNYLAEHKRNLHRRRARPHGSGHPASRLDELLP